MKNPAQDSRFALPSAASPPPSPSRKRLALAVHGVGNPNIGTIADPLRKMLGTLEPDISVDELNWNKTVGLPDVAGFFSFLGYVIDLFYAAMQAVCQPVVPPHRTLGRWSVLCGRCVEALAPAQALLVPFPIYVLVLWPWGLRPEVTLVWIAWLLGAVLCVNALLGLLSGNKEVFWGCLRAGLLPSLWTPLSVFLLVTIIPWPALAALVGYLVGYFEAVSWLYPGFTLKYLLAGQYQPMHLPGPIMKLVLEAVFFVGAVPVFFVVRWLWQWFYQFAQFQIITKVVGDIFLYLGNSDYRERLRAGAVAKFQDSLNAGVDDLVVCAHSLGTVVSADALAVMDSVQAPQTVRLITAGSPLYRTFWRFFPAVFPPPREQAAALKARHNGFQWVNVHRRLDYVGMRLRLAPEGLEVSTRQWWPMHTNYWADPIPAGKARELLALAQAAATPEAASTVAASLPGSLRTPAHSPHDSAASPRLHRAFFIAGSAILLSFAALVIVGAVRGVRSVVSSQATRTDEVAAYHAATDKRPTLVKVRSYPKARSGWPLAPLMGMAMNVQVMDRGLDDHMPSIRLVNSYAVIALTEASGTRITAADGSVYIEADLPGVEVASNPSLFTIDGAPAKPGWVQNLWLLGLLLLPVVYVLHRRRQKRRRSTW